MLLDIEKKSKFKICADLIILWAGFLTMICVFREILAMDFSLEFKESKSTNGTIFL